MLVLSAVLVVSTVVPSIDVTSVLIVLGAIAAVVLVAGGAWTWLRSRGAPPPPQISREDRASWRMPALALLERPTWSLARRVAMAALAGYIVLAVVMLVVKSVQLGIHA
jgi:hypothetical protein